MAHGYLPDKDSRSSVYNLFFIPEKLPMPQLDLPQFVEPGDESVKQD